LSFAFTPRIVSRDYWIAVYLKSDRTTLVSSCSNSAIRRSLRARSSRTSAVLQLPVRTQSTFGGALRTSFRERFGPAVTSLSCNRWAAFAISRKTQARQDVFVCELRKIGEHFLLSHSRRQIRQHVIHGDAHASHARLSAALARLNGDDLLVIHDVTALSLLLRLDLFPQHLLPRRR